MILLIGGTSETAPLAVGLAKAGYEVLVSQATEAPLPIPAHPRIRRRRGRLDATGMVALATASHIRTIVDASHPYAVAAHETAREASDRLKIPCFAFRRPESTCSDSDTSPTTAAADPTGSNELIIFAADHNEAAAIAFGFDRPVLLTTGSRNLAPYVAASLRNKIALAVRVLDSAESFAACRTAGIPMERIIAARGPFSAADTLAALRRFGCGVLVTKESGEAGGFSAKVKAAYEAGCRVVCIRRPTPLRAIPAYSEPEALITALKALLPPDKR